MAAVLTLATVGFVACGEKDNGKEDTPATYEESASFSFYYQGQKIAAGGTVEAVPTADELRNDFATLNLVVENKTDATVHAAIKANRIEGNGGSDIELCFNGNCRQIHLGDVVDITLEPGQVAANTVTYDYTPSEISTTTVYRITVGKGENMEDPQVIFIKHTK